MYRFFHPGTLLVTIAVLVATVTALPAIPDHEVTKIQWFALQQLGKHLQDEPTDPNFGVFVEGTGNPVLSLTLSRQDSQYLWTYTRFPKPSINTSARPVEWMTLTITMNHEPEEGRFSTREIHFIDDFPYGAPDQMTETYSERSPEGLENVTVDVAPMKTPEEQRRIQAKYDQALKVFIDYVNSPLRSKPPSNSSLMRKTF
jgi:hypothetical protein